MVDSFFEGGASGGQRNGSVAKHGAKSTQLTNAMVMRDRIRQSSKSGGRTLAKEFVNNIIVALPLWKFDSGSPALRGFSISEVSVQAPTLKPVCQGFSKHSCPRNRWDVPRRSRLGRYTQRFATRIQASVVRQEQFFKL